MIPTISVFCYRCRSETTHSLVHSSLYRCVKDCGSPWREILNAHEKTADFKSLEKARAIAAKESWRKESEDAMKVTARSKAKYRSRQ